MNRGDVAYECGEVLADAGVGVAEPDVVAEVVHVQHQAPHAVLRTHKGKEKSNLMYDEIQMRSTCSEHQTYEMN